MNTKVKLEHQNKSLDQSSNERFMSIIKTRFKSVIKQ